MLYIVALIALVGVATDTARAVHRERAVFAELGQTTVIKWLVWLYPLPLVIPLLGPSAARYLLFPVPLGVLFFVPAIAAGLRNQRRFERAGTDRVDRAQRAAGYVVMSGVLAAIGLPFFPLLTWLLGLAR
jgi:hypothetical protein